MSELRAWSDGWYELGFGSVEYFHNQLMQGCENPPDFFSLNSEVVLQFNKTVLHPEVSGDVKVQWFANLNAAYEKIIAEQTQEIEE